MINLPILKKLSISNYGLYPGDEEKSNLTIDFSKQGLTIILGANGLGKSTLINMLLRLMTGPSDISKIDSIDELGNLKIDAVDRNDLKSFFSERVADGAQYASALLLIELDSINITIERSLNDLSLTNLMIGETVLPLSKNRVEREETFKNFICDLSGVAKFGDWLLLLHFIIFYQENRRALVWDVSAQRELLRVLLLTKEQSTTWSELSRSVLQLDSEYRNFRSSINKEVKRLDKELDAINDNKGISAEINAEKSHRDAISELLKKCNEEIEKKLINRSHFRIEYLTINKKLNDEKHLIRNNKILLLNKLIPNENYTAKYIISTLFSETKLNNNSNVSILMNALEELLYENYASNGEYIDDTSESSAGPDYILELEIERKKIQSKLLDSELQLKKLTSEAESLVIKLDEINYKLLPLESSLSIENKPINKLRVELDALKRLKDDKEKNLKEAHKLFSDFLSTVEKDFLSHADTIQESFNKIVQGFLIEDCEVTWESTNWKLGQEERPIKFPSFLFKMMGSDHNNITIRTKPSQVSESQREFIDLSFRMALISVASKNGKGSIVMDAPESSLDAVFVERAAKVFNDFSRRDGNKLILASNLVDGLLLPSLLSELFITRKLDTGLVNLFEKGVPSKAIRLHSQEYKDHLKLILNKAKEIAKI